MKNGPVPWTFYNMLKGKAAILSKTGPAAWQSRPDPKGGKKVFFHSPERPANRDLFAPNDIKALEGALTFVKNSAYWEVRRRVHRDRAYIAGWNGRKGASSVMDYSLMRDDGDQELVAKLRSDSQHLMPH